MSGRSVEMRSKSPIPTCCYHIPCLCMITLLSQRAPPSEAFRLSFSVFFRLIMHALFHRKGTAAFFSIAPPPIPTYGRGGASDNYQDLFLILPPWVSHVRIFLGLHLGLALGRNENSKHAVPSHARCPPLIRDKHISFDHICM